MPPHAFVSRPGSLSVRARRHDGDVSACLQRNLRVRVLHVASGYTLTCEGGFNPSFQRRYGVDFVIFWSWCLGFSDLVFYASSRRAPLGDYMGLLACRMGQFNGPVQWVRFVGEPESSALSKLDGPPSPRGGLDGGCGYGLGSTWTHMRYLIDNPELCRPTVLYGIIVDSHRCPRWVSLEGSYCT